MLLFIGMLSNCYCEYNSASHYTISKTGNEYRVYMHITKKIHSVTQVN